jgi:predicted transcriptional regulator of viral defense system
MFTKNINNTLPLQQEHHVPQINISFNDVHQTIVDVVNQQNCGGSGTDSMINLSFY